MFAQAHSAGPLRPPCARHAGVSSLASRSTGHIVLVRSLLVRSGVGHPRFDVQMTCSPGFTGFALFSEYRLVRKQSSPHFFPDTRSGRSLDSLTPRRGHLSRPSRQKGT
ncbi:hypothetical protein LZ30DRAFT_476684 [Colletotrichum cereale]|nr:hypothetical protein LZ30DRAFT_476684 [Colletotrichum cereale]